MSTAFKIPHIDYIDVQHQHHFFQKTTNSYKYLYFLRG